MANSNLNTARKNKDDEFYTQLKDIEDELQHYTEFFKGKTIYLNCDNPKKSKFWEYFHTNFNKLKLKRLLATYYKEEGDSSLFDYKGGDDENVSVWKETQFLGNGDFRSDECINILKKSDIVITNPPFSLFRELIDLLVEYKKSFIIVGNQNSITHKNIFPLIKNNELWLGHNKGAKWFEVPEEGYGDRAKNLKIINNKKHIQVQGICWYTNIDTKKRHKNIELIKNYYKNESFYPKYDNYNAIEVSKVVDIPKDYDGIMGVPITFMYSYNPNQFEVVGCSYKYGRPDEWDENTKMSPSVNGKNIYKRIFIKKK